MDKLVQSIKQFINDEEGMGAVEYALIIAVVAAIILGAFNTGLGTAITEAFAKVTASLK
jgi:pilus assembly protein Flp/PilA